MIDIRVWDCKNRVHLDKCHSIIDEVYVGHTKSGWEVIIDLKHRRFSVGGSSSTSGGGGPTTNGIEFEDENEVVHHVEYEVPAEYCYPTSTSRLVKRNKDQVIVYYILNDLLDSKGGIEAYACPSRKIRDTLDRLGIAIY